jgi:hexosaminidase
MPIQETLIFPLQYIGDKINGFKGQVKNVQVKQE